MTDAITQICHACKRDTPVDRDFCVHCRAYQRWKPTIDLPTVPPADPPQSRAEPSPPQPLPVVPLRPRPEPGPAVRPGSGAQPPPPAPPARPPARPAPPAASPSAIPQAPPPAPAGGKRTLVAPTPPPLRRTALLACRRPEDESYASDPIVLDVAAGGEAELVVLVRNQDDVVDNYDLAVVGFPEGWASVEPGTVRLFPSGKSGPDGADPYEQEVTVRLRPPRSPQALARRWPARVVATSRTHRDQAASATFGVDIEPFHAIEAEVAPGRAGGRRRGGFGVAVHNVGNAPIAVALGAADTDQALSYDFSQARLDPAPGEPAEAKLIVRPPRPLLFGRPLERPFAVTATATDLPEQRLTAVLRQKPWIPRWALLLLPLLLIGLLLAWLLWFSRTEVPNLTGLSPFRAAQVLEERGLERGEIDRQRRRGGKGSVFDQTKRPGTRVRKGTVVGIQVAVGTTRSRVPDVRRRLLPEAEQLLQAKGFSVERVVGGGEEPERARVVRQDPRPRARRRQGTLVTLTVAVPKKGGEGKPTPAPGTPDPADEAKAAGAVAGLTAAAAAAKLEQAGFAVDRVERFSPRVKRGEVIRQSPAPDEELAPGATVTVVVSAGYPRIAYGDGRTVVVARGSDGKQAARIPTGRTAVNSEPAWSPDRTWLAFRRGAGQRGRIWRASLAALNSPQPLTGPGRDDEGPAVSPDGRVVAFIRDNGDERDLCFVRASARSSRGSCVKDPADVDRPAWSPDGRSVLTRTALPDERRVEVLRYASKRANSPRAADWQERELVTDGMHEPREKDVVVSFAWAPAGPSRLALATNWGESAAAYHVLLAPISQDAVVEGEPERLDGIDGCDLAWRPDGRELLVVAQPDCTQPTVGPIAIVDVARRTSRPLGVSGATPAWEPIRLKP